MLHTISTYFNNGLKLSFSNLALMLVIGYMVWNHFDNKIANKNYLASEQVDSILNIRLNDLGQAVITATTKELTESQQANDARYKQLNNRLRNNKVRPKNIKSAVGFEATIDGKAAGQEIIPEVIDTSTVDSLFKQYRLKDKYLTGDAFIARDGIELYYKLTTGNIYVDIYKKKPGVFRKDKTYTDISFDNPDIRITDTDIVVRKQPELRWTLGVYAGYGFTLSNGQAVHGPQVGIGVQIPIIKKYSK